MSTNPVTGPPRPEDYAAYIADLQNQRNEAQQAYETAQSNAQRKSEEINALQAALAKLNEYWQRIEGTDNKAGDIIDAIDQHEARMLREAFNAELTTDAAKHMVIDSEAASRKTEEIEDALEELLTEISSLPTPPPANSPIMAAVNAMANAIHQAMIAAEDTLVKSLETYQKAELLSDYIGNQDGDSGLVKAFNGLDKLINVEHHPGSLIHFRREGCPNDIWDRLKLRHDWLTRRLAKLQRRLNHFMREATLKADRVAAIDKALNAAIAAKTCMN
ncbi:MAG: hypothetical protein H6557_34450 [Lewinellaceae bacterium]|nr:hypothetical protein [Lewinellaceae bacterium]